MDESQQHDQLQAALATRNREFDALLDATKTLQDNFDRLADLEKQRREENRKLDERIAELEVANRQLTNMLWGRRSERRIDPNQQRLFPDGAEPEDDDSDVITADDEAQSVIDEELLKQWQERQKKKRDRKKKGERDESFPEHLERRERLLDLDDDEKAGLKHIGDAITERLRFERPYVYVERIVRRKYVAAGKPEEGVRTRPALLGIVEGCRYGFDVIATIIAQKYAFHQPTYRQQDWFAQCGWFPRRSTINDMLNHSVGVTMPLAELMWQRLLEQSIVHVDETTALVLLRDSLDAEQQEQLNKRRKKKPPDGEPGELNEPGSATSYAWLFSGLDDLAPYNYFHWSLSRSHTALDQWLATYQGTVVADAYEAYAHIEKRTDGRIVHASCNWHARREFVKAETYQPQLCAEAIALYGELCDIEERGRLKTVQERHELRQREAVPIWKTFERWLASDRVQRAALPRTPFGKAIGYMRNQWDVLQRYLTDGQLPFDNNQAERVIRPLAVGRRNWLFFGHPQAATGRLQLMSIVSSAHRHNLIVEDYLADILEKLADAAQNDPAQLQLDSRYLANLLPDRWASNHPTSIRKQRAAEKVDRAEAKRARRARQRILARRARKAAATRK
ncbi:MAG: IS66 family transposase [Planctomycetota bacterium]|nr:IS66 family transposase [Planctomycetota bacterium]